MQKLNKNGSAELGAENVSFKNKKLLYAFWRAMEETPYQHYYLLLKKMFGEIIVFDTEKNYFLYGKNLMREKLLETVRREKPDYLFFLILYDEIDPLTLIEIKKISPKTKILNLFGDDDWRFDDFSRYYAPFLDHVMTHHNVIDKYKKDGLENVFFSLAINIDLFRPLSLRKEYDVTFFGGPEYNPEYYNFFKKDSEIIMFAGKEDLLKKINYYLAHGDKRKKIASNAYKSVLKKYNQETKLKEFFLRVDKAKNKTLEINKENNIAYINCADLNEGLNYVKKKIQKDKARYIGFNIKKFKRHPLQEYLQTYSLEKSGKEISCCDYYVHSKNLGNYLLFKAKVAFKNLKKKEFDEFVKPAQMVMRTGYFLENFDLIIKDLKKNKFSLISEENAVFVSIPLVQIKSFHYFGYKKMGNAFQMKFLDNLAANYYNNKFLVPFYLLMIISKSLCGNPFILVYLAKAILSKDKIEKAKKYF